MSKNIILHINGGIGKCIAATAVCQSIKTKHPESNLIVISGYPEVFLGNPNVNRALAFGQLSYFYNDFIEGKDFEVLAHDPYLQTEYVQQNEHLVNVWCNMFGLPCENVNPSLYLTEREVQFYANKYKSDKPLFVIQTNGGAANQENKYSWTRDIPSTIVSKVIEKYSSDYTIVHIRREDQMSYPNTIPVSDNFRSLVVLLSMSKKRLLMDSFAQHAAAALQLPSTVLWIGNKPNVLGYNIHDNIIANKETKLPELRNSVFQRFNITGDALEFPYNNQDEIFDIEDVFASLDNKLL